MLDFSPTDRELCIKALTSRLKTAQLHNLVPPRLKSAVGALHDYRHFTGERLAALLIDLHGPELLRERPVRVALVQVVSDSRLRLLCTYDEKAAVPRSRIRQEKLVAARKWSAGKGWARHFVKVLGLPSIFVGSTDGGEEPPVVEVVPPPKLPALHCYQVALRDEVCEVLRSPAGRNRAILSLPTGAGKTRTVVEACASCWRQGVFGGDHRFLLWVAQSDELCEQAVDAFREVWTNLAWSAYDHPGGLPSLRILRLWSNRPLPTEGETGVVVASIQKLAALARNKPALWEPFCAGVGVVIVDEAHHAVAPSYVHVFEALGIARSKAKSRTPLLGLTATPYRGSQRESERLAGKFYRRLLAPSWRDPMGELRRRGILSHVQTRRLETHRRYHMNEAERARFEQFGDVPDTTLARIGEDAGRNKMLLAVLCEMPEGTPTLFFGCSVMHAQAMSLGLKREGRKAEVVTGATPRSLRRERIEAFRRGDIEFLCNYGVLTTGFDAPKVEAVVVARPTASALLYEQMIGRGLRGPVNGGTLKCSIVDTVDVIDGFGEGMSYARYLDLWTTEKNSHRIVTKDKP